MAHILVAEDDDNLRRGLVEVVTAMGHRVTDAINGTQGLSCQRSDPAELVITDIIMPEKDGLALITEIRRDYPAAKIIAISGGGLVPGKDYLRIARGMGAERVIEKPFALRDLITAIEELIGTGSASAKSALPS